MTPDELMNSTTSWIDAGEGDQADAALGRRLASHCVTVTVGMHREFRARQSRTSSDVLMVEQMLTSRRGLIYSFNCGR